MAELIVPELGESITEATVGRWLKQVGEAVDADEPLVDLETDKVTVQLPAPAAGALSELRAAEGDTVTVGQAIASFKEGSGPKNVNVNASVNESPKAPPTPAPTPTAPRALDTHGLTPSQRRAAREQGAVPRPLQALASQPVAAPTAAPTPATTKDGLPEDVVPMTTLRKRLAQRLVTAQQTAAILTTFNEIDMSNCMALRAVHKQAFFDKHGVKLGFMSFFMKACIAALQEFPGLNAEVREDSIAYKKYYNIGVAVGGGKGLVVPVVRHADRLGFADIEATITELATRARSNKLTLDELMGGTFTITNGGIYGSMMSTPLLNFPQTGILGMHNIVKRAVVVGDEVHVRPIMYVALSYDHRVVDGREAVQFLVAVKQRIEQPDKLMFDL